MAQESGGPILPREPALGPGSPGGDPGDAPADFVVCVALFTPSAFQSICQTCSLVLTIDSVSYLVALCYTPLWLKLTRVVIRSLQQRAVTGTWTSASCIGATLPRLLFATDFLLRSVCVSNTRQKKWKLTWVWEERERKRCQEKESSVNKARMAGTSKACTGAREEHLLTQQVWPPGAEEGQTGV